MNADKTSHLIHGGVTDLVIRVFYEVYNELGYGFIESVYCKAMATALRAQSIEFVTEAAVPVFFRGECVGDFRCDLIVARCVIVEVKAVSTLAQVHDAQLVNYLKATGLNVGLLLNFGPRAEFRRKVFNLGALPE
jgi:GxxExxY protein